MNAKFDDGKEPEAMRTIGEVAKALGIKPHVLRYWEQQFPTLRPLKGKGGRRHYRRADIELVEYIHHLVNDEGYTLKGARKVIEDGAVGKRSNKLSSAVNRSSEKGSSEVSSRTDPQSDVSASVPFDLPDGAALPEDGGVGRFFGGSSDGPEDDADDMDTGDMAPAKLVARLKSIRADLALALEAH